VTVPAARLRRGWKIVLLLSGVGLIAILAAAWYVTTDSFQAYVRRRLVAEVERITGGRAEIGSFHVVPFHLQVEVRGITVHGSEGPEDVPLAHVDHLVAQVKVISFLRTEFGFSSVRLEHPLVHIVMAADGSSNIPAPKTRFQSGQGNPVEPLFALSIDHLSVQHGELLWAGKRIPLDFTVLDTGAQMDYSYLRGRYEGRLALGKVDTVLENFRPFTWMTTVRFSLGTSFADVHSLKWNSGRSHVEVSGRISDFHNPRLDLSYEGHADLEELGAITRRHDLREGVAEFSGSGHWSAEEFTASGALALRDLTWQDDRLAVKKANASGDYAVTDQQLKVSKFQGKLFGGTVSGEAQVDNWLHSIPPSLVGKAQKGKESLPIITAARPAARRGTKEKLPGVQTGVVHLRLRDISAGEAAEAMDVDGHALEHFRPGGMAAGNVDASWKGSPQDCEITFALEVSPPAAPVAGELPVTAQMMGTYRGAADTLEVKRFMLSTPASRIQAEGTLAASSSLRMSVSTANLEEWRPLVKALGGPTDLPFRMDGGATFNGVAGGTFSNPTVAGTLFARDFEFTIPATSRTPHHEVHWDSLAASIQFSWHNLNVRGGSLRRGDTTADFEVTALLQKGQFTEYSPYTARVNLHNVDVASTATLAGFDYPVTGTADVSLRISGTRLNPQVVGHIRASDASAYGEAIEKFNADLHIAEGETALNNVQLTHLGGIVSGTAAYTPASRGFRLDLLGKNFDLARVPQIHWDRLPVEGRADFSLQGSGTLDAPVLDVAVQLRDLAFDREAAGNFHLEAVTQGRELLIIGRSDFVRGVLAVDGAIGMRGNYPANLTAHIDHLDLDALWRASLGGQLTGHSSVQGSLTMQGPLRYPRQWTLSGELSDVGLEWEYAKLHNQGPLRFSYARQTAHLEPAHLVGEGTDITGHGSIRFAGSRDVNLAADGQIDLKLLSSRNSDFTASGLMSIHMTVDGSLAQPLAQGSIQIKNGAVSYAGLPSGLSEMNGSMVFTRDRIHIEQLTAKTGGGTLDLKGDATTYNQQVNFNLTAVGKEVRLRYPPGVSSTANAELHWVGNRSASTVSGDILVTKLAVTPGFDFGSYLEHSRQSVTLAPANSPLYNVKLDVAVRTAPELQMKTAVARLSGDADLRLRGSVARPSVLGRADILEGDATFNGIKFRLERGDITFANPVAIEPQLNLQATTHVRNYDLDVTVTGTPDRLNVNYRSEPPLPKSDIIALLALGRTTQESEQLQQQSGQTPFTDEASALIINQAINQSVSNRLQKLFGVSRIKIDPQGLTTETNPTARGPQVTIEQQFANNLSLTYSTNVSQSSQQIIQGEYYFTRNISATGTRDQNGVVSFDVRVRRRKK
jgi:translocation and assembly module TamB